MLLITPQDNWYYGFRREKCLRSFNSKNTGGDPNTCVRNFNYEKPIKGLGHCIHTYECDGEVLPSFIGEPYLMPIQVSADSALDAYWAILNQDNIISLLVKTIDINTGEVEIKIKNRHNI